MWGHLLENASSSEDINLAQPQIGDPDVISPPPVGRGPKPKWFENFRGPKFYFLEIEKKQNYSRWATVNKKQKYVTLKKKKIKKSRNQEERQ